MSTELLILIALGAIVVFALTASLLMRRGDELPPTIESDLETDAEIHHPEELGIEDEPSADDTPDVIERPESAAGRLTRLRTRLARSNSTLGKGLLAILGRADLDQAAWDELEETLLAADVGIGPTTELVDSLRTRLRVEGSSDPSRAREILRE